MSLSFSKYAGSGNDFIFVDNRDQKFIPDPALIRSLCERKKGIGADGLITLELGEEAPFRMKIFNADGYEAEMCGNGLRCFKKFLAEKGVKESSVLVQTKERLLRVTAVQERVKTTMGTPTELLHDIELESGYKVDFINTGVPHAVRFVDSIDKIDLEKEGPFIRHHPTFGPRGANANFVEVRGSELWVRTYERGVEGETLACGTGMVAAACLAALKFGLQSPIKTIPRSGEFLEIHINIKQGNIAEVEQIGPAELIFQGSFSYGP